MEDALAAVLEFLDRDLLVRHTSAALASLRVRIYHATRVTPEELASIERDGLKPLRLAERRARIAAILEVHPRWLEVAHQLDIVLERLGPGKAAGNRESGGVYGCFSRAGLLHGCSHYLTTGAEVDRHVCHRLFGDHTGLRLLHLARSPKLVTSLVPFADAARAANPYGFPQEELPALLRTLLQYWAYWLTHPGFTVATQRECMAARFEGGIPAEHIERIEHVLDADVRHDWS